ncbi:MAG TPA: adenosine deaminase [Candidatus Dormibacteraeota bacterium]|nr:adenosine deaminase [Candidatus Dormibacteraeota bacterium]
MRDDWMVRGQALVACRTVPLLSGPPPQPSPHEGEGGHLEEFGYWRKAELHCHLDGAVRPATALGLAREQGLDLARPLRMVAPDDCPSQAAFLAYFDDPLAVLQTAPALELAAYELGVDKAADNVDYLEVRWAPNLHLRAGLTLEEVIEAVLRGLDAAPLRAVAIACAMRHHSVADNVAMARVAGRYAGRGLVGFDLAGDEAAWPAAPHRPAFEAARAAGLRLTCHAGEAGPPAHVEEALDLGVERVAHGVTGAGDPRVVARLRAEGLVLDLCPTANWKCKAVRRLADHPLPGLVRGGVRCTISTDSPTVAATTLTEEFRIAHDVLGLTPHELWRCNETAHDARFDR